MITSLPTPIQFPSQIETCNSDFLSSVISKHYIKINGAIEGKTYFWRPGLSPRLSMCPGSTNM